ncbi:hypothetical protein Gocc_1157 [Gaiella occulta]|uniref:Uncharacterized protein n=2 Tax=Gaiella occulta TaxID=1002870 RepID=A0A7M2YZB2_9ACTN|nr:hypothetical protein Gocc_1157 [Gaiella occulta]
MEAFPPPTRTVSLMATPTVPEPEGDGAALLAHEIRDEASRLAHHPVEEMERLGHVVAEGESPTTPLLLTLGVTLVVGAIFAVVVTAALLVYYYA